jgi:hypothetical protein
MLLKSEAVVRLPGTYTVGTSTVDHVAVLPGKKLSPIWSLEYSRCTLIRVLATCFFVLLRSTNLIVGSFLRTQLTVRRTPASLSTMNLRI